MEIVAVMKLEITGLPISNNAENLHEQLFSKPRKSKYGKTARFLIDCKSPNGLMLRRFPCLRGTFQKFLLSAIVN